MQLQLLLMSLSIKVMSCFLNYEESLLVHISRESASFVSYGFEVLLLIRFGAHTAILFILIARL